MSRSRRTGLRAALLLAAAFALTACGGGGADPTLTSAQPGVEPPAEQAGFLQAFGPVEGVTYQTATRTGTTGPDGAFTFATGETITFHVGPLQLGEAVAAAATLTPTDLVPGSSVPRTREAVSSYEGATPPEMVEFVNLLTFLRAFDRDKDDTNGIQIHPDVASVLAGSELSMTRPRRFFAEAIRPWLYRARNAGLVANARLESPERNLDRYAAHRGVRPPVWGISTQHEDFDGDGSWDQIQRRFFDDERYPFRFEFDHDGDGTLNRASTFVRDEYGQVIRNEVDPNGVGTDVTVSLYEYDDDGNLTRTQTLVNGTLASIRQATIDDMGNTVRSEYDAGANGTVDSVTTFAFDDQGRLTQKVFDNRADGNPDHVTSLEYMGTNRKWTRTVLDRNGDGVPDRISTREFNAAGASIRRTEDSDGDGVYERSTLYTRDANGNIVEESVDSTGSGVHTVRRRLEYDEDGRETRHEQDHDGDGTVDRLYLYTYDHRGLRIRFEESIPGGRTLIRTYEYNAAGQQTRLLMENLLTMESQEQRWTYDAAGHLVEHTRDIDGDGVIDERTTQEVDQNGNATRRLRDVNGDGTIDHVTEWTWVPLTFAGSRELDD